MNLRKRSIQTLSAISLTLALPACKGAPPKVDLPLWAARHESQSIVRTQAHEEVKCSDPAFNDYVCTRYEKLKRVLDLIWACEKWPTGLQKMTAQEIDEAIELYSVVAEKAKKQAAPQ